MFRSYLTLAAIAVASTASAVGAVTTPFEVRYESAAPGMQATSATFSTGGVETFEGRSSGNFSSNFGTAGLITGIYTGATIDNANQYGGAGGTGKFATTTSSYTLDLSTTVAGGNNFFGFWLSALDHGNVVSFYSHGHLLFDFNPSDVLAAVAGNAAYLGNPNAPFAGQNTGEPYVFLSFFSNDRPFDKIVFAEHPSVGGYESDNHTVGHFTGVGTGTLIPLSPGSFPTDAVPEPATWAMMMIGFGAVGAMTRRRRNDVVAA